MKGEIKAVRTLQAAGLWAVQEVAVRAQRWEEDVITVLWCPLPHRILSQDGITESVKQRRYYEKPCRKRQRLAYEACRRVYNTEMARKISFLSRKSRTDPWLGC